MLLKIYGVTIVVPKVAAVLDIRMTGDCRFSVPIIIGKERISLYSATMEEARKDKEAVEKALQEYYGD